MVGCNIPLANLPDHVLLVRMIQYAMVLQDGDAAMDNAANCTPELCSCAIGTSASQKQAPPTGAFFSLFRPTVQRKVICTHHDYNGGPVHSHHGSEFSKMSCTSL